MQFPISLLETILRVVVAEYKHIGERDIRKLKRFIQIQNSFIASHQT